MKTTIKFKCFDCGKDVVTSNQPQTVIRKNPNSVGAMRVKVCKRCLCK